VVGVPCICGHQTVKAMQEIKEREEQEARAEVREEERRNRMKELPIDG
jgi:hypothetical protein